ncbi:uroporphyrinogen-III synthase-like [Lineus longissimus]|uniref:uroporphyrinogen-III synthase-like n=1 Tax=Lineus longissimus TaxID=88925 RepID=UPI002B4ED0AA
MEVVKGSVLLFKAAKEHGQDPYEQALKEKGIKVFSIPVLTFQYLNLEELRKRLNSPDRYSCLVFTSQRALDAVELAIKVDNTPLDQLWKDRPVFVVGKTTAEAAEKVGFVTTGSDTGNAEALAPVILKNISEDTRPVFFPCGNLRKETIPHKLKEKGYTVDSLVVYETSPNPDVRKNLQDLIQKEGVPELVSYFSPSGVQFTKPLLEELKIANKTKYISMGPSTTIELEKQSMPVEGEAKKPTKEGVIEEIIHVLQKYNSV